MKILKKILLGILIFLLFFAGYLFTPLEIPFLTGFIGTPSAAEKITWGVNFSQKHTQSLGLDWQQTYLALLEDLGVRNLKVSAQWDLIELEKDKYNFEDLDWQIKEAEKKRAKILLVIGMKTGRWPECHISEWAKNLSKEEQQKEILEIIEEIVLRYKNSPAILYWQVENEPFFPFGECPWVDKNFVKKEIELVKKLDFKSRPVVISDSGEGSFWIASAKLGDIVGATMYKKVWMSFPYFIKKNLPKNIQEFGFYFNYPFPPTFYWRKAQIIKKFFGKKVIGVELQAEPWGPALLYDSPLKEQEKTMNLKQFKKNIEFAKKTGFDTFYLWGAEWWYWLKEKQGNSSIWNEAKKLF